MPPHQPHRDTQPDRYWYAGTPRQCTALIVVLALSAREPLSCRCGPAPSDSQLTSARRWGVGQEVWILGSLDGVETGIRNLIRTRPLEIEEVSIGDRRLRVPTLEEILRIKAWLCLMRNATRDYVDLAALADRLAEPRAADVVAAMDLYYDDQVGSGGRRVATQVARQLAEPRPFDLTEIDLAAYRRLEGRWQDWGAVADLCRRLAVRVLEKTAGGES